MKLVEFNELIEKSFEREMRRAKEETKRIADVQASIKHPHFYYAVYDTETGEVQYKRKKWYQWFSGKRIVYIKIVKLDLGGLADYYEI